MVSPICHLGCSRLLLIALTCSEHQPDGLLRCTCANVTCAAAKLPDEAVAVHRCIQMLGTLPPVGHARQDVLIHVELSKSSPPAGQ